jgi:hypothetical protein
MAAAAAAVRAAVVGARGVAVARAVQRAGGAAVSLWTPAAAAPVLRRAMATQGAAASTGSSNATVHARLDKVSVRVAHGTVATHTHTTSGVPPLLRHSL